MTPLELSAAEGPLAVLVGLLFAASLYMMLSRSLIRMVIGIVLLGNAVNLLIFVSGRLTREIPPIVPPGMYQPDGIIANPLPQALILTAIVISFALFAFVLVMVYRTDETLGTDFSADMRLAEPRDDELPPLGY